MEILRVEEPVKATSGRGECDAANESRQELGLVGRKSAIPLDRLGCREEIVI